MGFPHFSTFFLHSLYLYNYGIKLKEIWAGSRRIHGCGLGGKIKGRNAVSRIVENAIKVI